MTMRQPGTDILGSAERESVSRRDLWPRAVLWGQRRQRQASGGSSGLRLPPDVRAQLGPWSACFFPPPTHWKGLCQMTPPQRTAGSRLRRLGPVCQSQHEDL
ncbi:hypothetical protein MUG91_G103n76 [Manis pentadactyla]|nr:hypothetical protein MUG91_G103n76 [Manis pentadactyla]